MNRSTLLFLLAVWRGEPAGARGPALAGCGVVRVHHRRLHLCTAFAQRLDRPCRDRHVHDAGAGVLMAC
jgi:hypothetical protein